MMSCRTGSLREAATSWRVYLFLVMRLLWSSLWSGLKLFLYRLGTYIGMPDGERRPMPPLLLGARRGRSRRASW
jgi:hypothetical protein